MYCENMLSFFCVDTLGLFILLKIIVSERFEDIFVIKNKTKY